MVKKNCIREIERPLSPLSLILAGSGGRLLPVDDIYRRNESKVTSILKTKTTYILLCWKTETENHEQEDMPHNDV